MDKRSIFFAALLLTVINFSQLTCRVLNAQNVALERHSETLLKENFESGTAAFPWVADAAKPWTVVTTGELEGAYAIRSGEADYTGTPFVSTLTLVVHFNQPAKASFLWTAPGATYYYGSGNFTVDGVTAAQYTPNEYGTLKVRHPLAPGEHTLCWSYECNNPQASDVYYPELNYLYLDSLTFTFGGDTINLWNVSRDTIIRDGQIVVGELCSNVKVCIEADASVTLSGIGINSADTYSTSDHAGLTCLGDAHITLKGANTVKSLGTNHPGIKIAKGALLTIDGDGALNVTGGNYAAGIGAGKEDTCGSITILSGTITAQGGDDGAGIGSGYYQSLCGDITIKGGTVNATGNNHSSGIGAGSNSSSCGTINILGGTVTATGTAKAAGIGSSAFYSSCGPINISDSVIRLTATKGVLSNNTIGPGANSTCGPVTIGGITYWDGNNYQNGGGDPDGIVKNPYIYPSGKDTLTLAVNNPSLGTILPGLMDTVWLDTVTADITLQDWQTVTGTLHSNIKISIADSATITLAGATIFGTHLSDNYQWAGLNCEGDATIILASNLPNKVRGFFEDYPGILVPEGKTLTIRGTGILQAISNGKGAGIGGGYDINAGNIVIEGGTIGAFGGSDGSAGIGSGPNASCGNISITGGDITAGAGMFAPGIGSGANGSCGDITITSGVTKVLANRGDNAPKAVGAGLNGTCGTVTVGGQTGQIANTLNYFGDGSGSGLVDSSYLIEHAKRLVVTARANPCHHLASWSDGHNVIAVADQPNLYRDTVTIFRSTTLRAIFEKDTLRGDTTIEAQGSQVWGGREYTANGDYEATVRSVGGCDSIVTLHLTVIPCDTITVAVNDTAMGSIEVLDCNLDFVATDTINLDTVSGHLTVGDRQVLTGTLGGSYKISIADGATVLLDGINIEGDNDANTLWAGLSCMGDATLLLAYGTSNVVRGYQEDYPGIHVPEYKTLTIGGCGSLEVGDTNSMSCGIGGGSNATSNEPLHAGNIVIEGGEITAVCGGFGRGIGGGAYERVGSIFIKGGTINAKGIGAGKWGSGGDITISGGTIRSHGDCGIGAASYGSVCGDITISGGDIEATGDMDAAGIGTGGEMYSTCGNITISGGNVRAHGGRNAAGIGAGYDARCGDITITNGVLRVKATKGAESPESIGSGTFSNCGTVTIGNATGSISDSAYIYTGQADDDGNHRVAVHHDSRYIVAAHPKPCYRVAAVSNQPTQQLAVSYPDVYFDTVSVNGNMSVTAYFMRDTIRVDTAVATVDPYRWQGRTYRASGEYHDTLVSSMGCDSLVTLHLTIIPDDTLTLAVNDTAMGSVEVVDGVAVRDTVNLGTITASYTVPDGTMLTGTLNGNYKITIAAGATVVLSGVTIDGTDKASYAWAGLNCEGDATIVLNKNTENYVKGFYRSYPGIHVPWGSTLTIRGNGALEAYPGGIVTAPNYWDRTSRAAGIGGGMNISCGNIVIEGGEITAAAYYAASIGGGMGSSNNNNTRCGNITIRGGDINAMSIGGGNFTHIDSITITGGRITAQGDDLQAAIGTDGAGTFGHILITGGVIDATGGSGSPAIGGGRSAVGGQIVISDNVARVTATAGRICGNSIGNGSDGSGISTVIAGNETDNITTSPYTYYGVGDSVSSDRKTVIGLTDGRYIVRHRGQVVVKASPKVGHHLESWSDGAEINTTLTDTVIMDGNMLLTANFAVNQYTISATTEPTAGGTVSGEGEYMHGDTATMIATADPCYHFVNWTDAAGSTVLGSEDTLRLMATSDSSVAAHFALNTYSGDTTASECDQFSWHDSTYSVTPAVAPTYVYTTAAGCDSTVSLLLTVRHSSGSDTTASECDQFSWHDSTYRVTPAVAPTYVFNNAAGCDSTVTLHLTVRHSNSSDTTAVECDQFRWHDSTYSVTPAVAPTHVFSNVEGCDSTVTLHLTVNYQNTGDSNAVECDRFDWYEHNNMTSSQSVTHLFAGSNQWGCDSTVTLHLTVNYQNTGDTNAIECDRFDWYEHNNMTSSQTVTHLFAGSNQWGCDSTVTLHLTVNYQNTGDTSTVECDNFDWYEHNNMTSSQEVTHVFVGSNQWGCDSTVTLHLTINYQSTGDTNAVKCDSFDWYEHNNMTTTQEVTHLFAGGNQWSCDSTVTLHLTVNHQNTGDTSAVKCDRFDWYDHNNMTTSQEVTHLFTGSNLWGCDSTVTLHLTVNHQNTGDTSAVKCDRFDWYEHSNMTTTQEVTHLFVGGNQWGCDSTTTLHLTVNYQNTGDTSAVECDRFDWYEHNNMTTTQTVTHLFAGGNRWGCDSTTTLHLTVNYQNTGDTSAVECDRFNWYEHGNMTTSREVTHLFTGSNQWGCDSTVTLHLTVNYRSTGDTNAVKYEPFTWYEHVGLASTQEVMHVFVGGNMWGCDSTVTLHLKYPLYMAEWAGDSVVTYNAEPQKGLIVTYIDDTGALLETQLTFKRGNETIVSPEGPTAAGLWSVTARPLASAPLDSLVGATGTLRIEEATVRVSGAVVEMVKFEDGNNTAAVTNAGVLVGVQGNDALGHSTTASYGQSTPGEELDVTLRYALTGAVAVNYKLEATEEIRRGGAILERYESDENNITADAYGYCAGRGTIGYALTSGKADEYRIDFEDSRIASIGWTRISTEGSVEMTLPDGLPMGDYEATMWLRDHKYPEFVSGAMAVRFHVDLPDSYVKPLFSDLIALIDTCHCMTDVQWYHRGDGETEWKIIPGANDYFCHEAGGLTGEYRVSVKMNGVETYTCPQGNMKRLIEEEGTYVKAWPNPTSGVTTVSIYGSHAEEHMLKVHNTTGVEVISKSFIGKSTKVDLTQYPQGQYMVSVDGIVIKVVKR